MRRAIPIAVAIAVLGSAPGAAATNRYAAPTSQGSGSCLSPADACGLPTAVAGSSNGDQVFARADLGPYNLGSTSLSNPTGTTIHLHGLNGRPQLSFTGARLIFDAASSVDGVSISEVGSSDALQLGNGASADSVIAESSGPNGATCGIENATVTNSICWSRTSLITNGAVMIADGQDTLRGDTIVDTASDSAPAINVRGLGDTGLNGLVDVVNVIARGGTGGGPGVQALSDGSKESTVNMSYSNATTALAGPPASPAHEHVNTDSSDQAPNAALPLFVNAPQGNFHEAIGAPTINHGVNSPANGTHDFEGDPRTLNGRTDIGADEFVDRFEGVSIVTSRVKVKRGHAHVRLQCPGNAAPPSSGGAATCTGTLKLESVRVHKRRKSVSTLGSASFTIAAGRRAAVAVRLSSKALHLLQKRHHLKALAVAVAHDGLGTSRVTTAKVKLKLHHTGRSR